MLTILSILLAFIIITYAYMQQDKFGKQPSGERLQRIMQSLNYRDGKFQNQNPTPDLTDGANYYSVLRDFIFKGSKRSKPLDVLPSQKTNLLSLSPDKDILV